MPPGKSRESDEDNSKMKNGKSEVNGCPPEAEGGKKDPNFPKSAHLTKSKTKSRLSSYVIALRPWSLTASLTPVALGSCLAYKQLDTFNLWIFLITCAVALSVHAAGNLVNSYFDYMRGVDSGRTSDDRTLVDSIVTPNDVATMGAVCYFVGCIGFSLLVFLSPARMEHLALLYFGGLSGSFLYTGGLGLKYIALGDVAVFLTFGPVTVLFAYLSQGGPIAIQPLLYAIPLALNTEAILHANNTRDMASDTKVGIVTLAILIGRTWSYVLFTILLFVPYVVFAVLTLNFSRWFVLPLTTVFLAFKYERSFREGNLQQMPKHMARLNLQLGLLYTIALALSAKNQLPGIAGNH